ncbi:MAG: TonB-dependent receptor [Candidatus Solibacter sp.]
MPSRIYSMIAILCLLIAGSAWAQDTKGTISGRVTDQSGSVIPNAAVTVTNSGTAAKTDITTNAEGIYRAAALAPGEYQVAVTQQGFKKAIRNVEVRVADRLDISIQLEVGGAEQTVTVSTETPLLSTESASNGTVIDSKRISDLPVSYGNPFLLIGLTAGVTFNGSVRLDRPFEPTHIVNFSMGGTRGNLNDITIDGAPATATANGNEVTASYVPMTDIVQEFKVQTNTFDAGFGQTQGGVTTISIKSGTNNLHGSVNYSFQRPSFWANDFFLNKAGTPRPDFLFNRWGGSLSGPVWFPKLYNGKNKTFFLFGYEGIRDSRPRHDDTTNTIPTPAMQGGDFSALLSDKIIPATSRITIYDPSTRQAIAGGRIQSTPFPNNVIPSNQFDPVGKAIMNYYPKTETTPGDPLGLSNYQDATTAEKAKYYNVTGRIDQNLGDKQRFFVRYSKYIRNSTYNEYFKNAFVGDQFYFYAYSAAFDHVATITPTVLLNTRYSYNRFIRGGDQPESAVGFDLASLKFSPQFIAQVPPDQVRFPRINYASTSYIGNGHTNERRPVNNHTVAATLTKSAGKHSVRTGFEYRVYQEADSFKSNQQTVQFTFGTTWTRGQFDNTAGSTNGIGQSIAAFLLGKPDSGSITRQSDYIEQSGSWGFFVQDDWKLTPKLTVNLGLRYEFETPLHERYNRSTLDFLTSYTQPISAAAQAAYASIYPTLSGGFAELPPSALVLKGGMTFAGENGNGGGLYHTPKNVFMPRLGIAYQLDNKTVLRTGMGMFAGFLGERRGDVIQQGFTQNTAMTVSRDNGLTFAATMANPFPTGVAEAVGSAAGLQTYLGQGLSYFNQSPKIPITTRWEASLQRQIGSFLLQADYIGNKTNHIELTRNINTLPFKYLSTMKTRDDVYNAYLTQNIANPLYNLVPGNTQGIYTSTTTNRQTLLSPFPAFGSNAINATENTGYAWYHSFQFTASKRFSKGFTVQGSYTYQKWQQAVNLLNPSDLRPIEEISDADAPHRINISSVWALPFGKGRHFLNSTSGLVERLVGGWEISGIWSLQSGFPLQWNNALYYGNPADIVLPLGQRSPDHWFNVANFEAGTTRQLLANQVRTWPLRFSQIRGPRQNNVDVAVIKQTRITEGKNLEFRAEALNLANHPLFPNPNMTLTTAQTAKDTGFGQISASTMNNYARRLQMSLRFLF